VRDANLFSAVRKKKQTVSLQSSIQWRKTSKWRLR
jgi:hypothetical protein